MTEKYGNTFFKYRKTLLSILILVLGVGVFIPSAFSQRKKDKKKKGQINAIQEEPVDGEVTKRLKAEHAFMEGMKEFIKNEYKRAIPFFESSLSYDKTNHAAYYQIALSNYRLNQLEEALMNAIKANEIIDNPNFYYLNLQANLERDLRMMDSAEETYQKIINQLGGTEVIFFDLAALYIEMNELKKAIRIYNEMEKVLGLNQTVVRQKQILYLQMNDTESAVLEGQKLIEAYPEVIDFQLAQIELLLNQKKYADAERLLEKITKEEEEFPPQVHLLLAQVYHHQDKTEQETFHLEKAFASSEMSLDNKLNLLINLYQKKNDEESIQRSIKLARLLAKTHPRQAASHSILGDFLFRKKVYSEANEAYAQALKIDPNNYALWERTIQSNIEIQDYSKAVRMSEDALEYFPNQPNLWLLNGLSHFYNEKYAQAVSAIKQGSRLVANDPLMVSQFDSQLGDIYNKTKEYQKADQAYERAIAKNPNNAHALNNYSYYLSLRGENLKRAEEFSERLVKLFPNNSTYLDTHGWVLYVKGDYQKAEKFLEQAANNSKSATVLEHYGDVLFKLGKKDKALEQWKKAQSIDKTNEALNQKILNGFLPE